ncbi:MAG: hypothetical protein R3C28_01745 [Pirellulaceae bacterium]
MIEVVISTRAVVGLVDSVDLEVSANSYRANAWLLFAIAKLPCGPYPFEAEFSYTSLLGNLTLARLALSFSFVGKSIHHDDTQDGLPSLENEMAELVRDLVQRFGDEPEKRERLAAVLGRLFS